MKKILLIDDNDALCEIIRMLLEKEGFAVAVSHDGNDGLDNIHKEKPDLVILDLGLPGLPGEEVCRRIRKDDDIAKTPVIMLTAKQEDSDRIVGRVIGADSYITKPFESEKLLKEMNRLLSRSGDNT